MLQKAFHRLSEPISRWLLKTLSIGEAWQKYPHPVPLHRYGLGARQAFTWYFEGDCRVEVHSVADIIVWLLGCDYVCDPDLFNEDDYWQHPKTFEQLQRGDCEDFSLWAWRRLVELGLQAEFVAGRCVTPHCQGTGHTWVLLHQEDEILLLDPVIRDPELMLQPLTAVQHAYVPEVSVDGTLTRYVYAGYLRHLRDQ